jgi:hypothetical protein
MKKMGKGAADFYNREVKPLRQEIYKQLGFSVKEGEGFTRYREVENFIRAWSEARANSKEPGKIFNPDKNSAVKSAWEKMFLKHNKGVFRPAGGGTKGPGKQNLLLGAVEALDQGAIKKADIARLGCPAKSFADYDALEPVELKTLVSREECRVTFDTANLVKVFRDHAHRLEPEGPLCRILDRQLQDLHAADSGQSYRDIEVPQRPEAQGAPAGR